MDNLLYNVSGSADVNTFNQGMLGGAPRQITASAPRIISQAPTGASPYVSNDRQVYNEKNFDLFHLFSNLGNEAGRGLSHLMGMDTNEDMDYQSEQLASMTSKGYTLSTDDQGNKSWVNDKGDVQPYKPYDDSKPFGERIIPKNAHNIIGQQIFDGIMSYELSRWQGADKGTASAAMMKSMMYRPKRPDYKWNTQVDKDGNLMAYTVTGTQYDAQGNPLPQISKSDTGIDVKQKEASAPKMFSITRDGEGTLFKTNLFTGETTRIEGSRGKPDKADKEAGHKTFTDAEGKVFAWDPKDPTASPILLSDVTKPQSATVIKANAAAADKQKDVVDSANSMINDLMDAARNPYTLKVVGGMQGNEMITRITTLDDDYNKAHNQVKKLLGAQMQANIAVQGKNFSDGDRMFFQSFSDFSPSMSDSEFTRRVNAYTYLQAKVAYDANNTDFEDTHGYKIVNNSLNRANGKFRVQIKQPDGTYSNPVTVDSKALGDIDLGYQGLGTLSSQPTQPVQPKQTSQYTEGMTATNPSTGQRVVYRNGRWEAL